MYLSDRIESIPKRGPEGILATPNWKIHRHPDNCNPIFTGNAIRSIVLHRIMFGYPKNLNFDFSKGSIRWPQYWKQGARDRAPHTDLNSGVRFVASLRDVLPA